MPKGKRMTVNSAITCRTCIPCCLLSLTDSARTAQEALWIGEMQKPNKIKENQTNLWQLIRRDVGCKTVETFLHLCYFFLIILLFKSMGGFMGANILYSYVSSKESEFLHADFMVKHKIQNNNSTVLIPY